jgi:hypothetical protein
MSTQEDFRNLDSEQLRNIVFTMGVNIAKFGDQINDLATEINMLRDNLKGNEKRNQLAVRQLGEQVGNRLNELDKVIHHLHKDEITLGQPEEEPPAKPSKKAKA